MKQGVLAAAILLAGCATYGQDRALIDATIDSLVGQPLQAATSHFGVPVESHPIGDGKSYIWRRDNVYFDGGDDTLKCEIRLLTDASGTITAGEHQGNNYACSLMAERLK